MLKLILCCNYLKHIPASHLSNFIDYIGTREGVEKVGDTTGLLPSTVKQEELIKDISLIKLKMPTGCTNIMTIFRNRPERI